MPNRSLNEIRAARSLVFSGAGAAESALPWGPALDLDAERLTQIEGHPNQPYHLDASLGDQTLEGGPQPDVDVCEVAIGLDESTRRQLLRMYGERLEVPRPPESERAERKRILGVSRDVSPRTRRLRRRIGAVIATGVVVLAGGQVSSMVRASQASVLRDDASTPADQLPWRDVRLGSLVVALPGEPDVSTRVAAPGGESTYERYDLAGIRITMTVLVRDAAITSDEALRRTTDGLAQSYGRALTDTSVEHIGWGDTLTARIIGGSGETRVHLVAAASVVLQLTGDTSTPPGDREERIFQRIARSVQPG